MFSLQRLLGKEDVFLGLFERAASEAAQTAKALQQFIHTPTSVEQLEAVSISRERNKQTCEEISSLLIATFVTALEREDIESLADSLYRLPKPQLKFAQRYAMAHEFIADVDFQPQVELITRGVLVVEEMIKEFRKDGVAMNVRALNSRLQRIETEADDLENRLLHSLYATRTNALRVLIVKDLYTLLEKSVDRCRDAGNVLTNVVLKNA